jgi:hypothetical protein
VGSTLGFLGLQDATRKRREPRQDPGAWAGSVVRSDVGAPEVQVSVEKWIKTKVLVNELSNMLEKNSARLPRQRLLEIRVFLLMLLECTGI